MKISLNWIKDFVDIPADLSIAQLAHDLTMCTVEVEDAHDVGGAFHHMVVGQVVSLAVHPNADKLQLAQVDVGSGEVVPIVCGGSNLSEEMFVAVASPGAEVQWHGEEKLTKLKTTKIRGERSEGMICSSVEIGLGDLFPAEDEREIIDLSPLKEECKLEAGMPLACALGLDDVILDIDNKSLTNRPDLWGHYGMARELAAIYGQSLKPLTSEVALPNADATSLKVSIENTERCKRYLGVDIDNVTVTEAPFWMKARLSLIDQRSINFLVDLTNYVLFTVGQPLHVFDYGQVGGHEIIVRSARANEKLLLLDGEEHKFLKSDLVIADAQEPVALAGIMGGDASSVVEATTRIVLESASFEPTGLRRTASRLGVRSESSMRFEKGIDSPRVKQGVDLFINLLLKEQGDINLVSALDCYPIQPDTVSISVNRSFINSRIGEELTVDDIRAKLEALDFQVEEKDEEFTLQVPSWRATGDVSIPEDIVEEVARLYGYDNIKFSPPTVVLEKPVFQRDRELSRRLREYFAYHAGMNEIVTYPWVEDEFLSAAGVDGASCVTLHAPPSPSCSNLRPSLIPGLLFAVRQNRRHFDHCAVFEVGRVFLPEVGHVQHQGQKDTLPSQPTLVSGAVMGKDAQSVYRQARGIVEELFPRLRLEKPVIRKATTDLPGWAARESTLEVVTTQGVRLGQIALLSGGAAHKVGIKRCQVALFELCTDDIASMAISEIKYESVPQFPIVEYDLAVLIEESTSWDEIREVVSKSHQFIRQIEFMDEYRGEQVPEGKKSVAFRSTLSNPEGTLSSDEVNEVGSKIYALLNKQLGAEMRAG